MKKLLGILVIGFVVVIGLVALFGGNDDDISKETATDIERKIEEVIDDNDSETAALDTIAELPEETNTSEDIADDAPEFPYTECDPDDLKVFFESEYGHVNTDIITLGNGEKGLITITAPFQGMTYDDLFIYYEEDELDVQTESPKEKENSTIFNLSVTGKKAGLFTLTISTMYELVQYGEQSSGFEISIKKLDQADGKIVYYAPTGEKYHFSESCAGENARKTTLWDAQAIEIGPCRKCAS